MSSYPVLVYGTGPAAEYTIYHDIIYRSLPSQYEFGKFNERHSPKTLSQIYSYLIGIGARPDQSVGYKRNGEGTTN